MKQYTVSRLVGVIPFAAGQPASIDLPRQYDLASIGLRISGTYTNADDGSAQKAESPVGLIQRIEVISDGKNTIHSMPFWKAAWANFERRASVGTIAELRVRPTALTAAGYSVLASGYVDCQTVDGMRPKDSNFRTAGLSLFQLKLTFGNPATDVLTGVDAATFVGNVEVWVDECVELPDPSTGKFSTPKFLKKTSFQEYNVSGSNSNYEVRLPAGNLIRSVFVRAANASSGEPGASFVNKLTLQSGVDTRFTESAAAMRAKMSMKYGALGQAGYYLADLASVDDAEIRLANLWDVSRQAEPKAFLDIASACTLQVVTTEYIPLASAA
jgi:hypothetical protein